MFGWPLARENEQFEHYLLILNKNCFINLSFKYNVSMLTMLQIKCITQGNCVIELKNNG